MTTVQEKRKAFHELVRQPGCAIAPSAHDALSAMLVERAGFKVVHMSGSAIHKLYGYSDVGLLTLTEMALRSASMAEAVSIPLIGDGETGYGNVVNVVRAVREFERAGVAAIHIEDQMTPKRPGGEAGGKGFVSKEEFAGKIAAAVEAREDPTFSIIARVDAREEESFDLVVERAKAASKAGADVLWLGLNEVDELREMANQVDKPLMGVPRRPKITPQIYGEAGFKIAVLPGMLVQAASWGMAKVLETLRDKGGTEEFFGSLEGMREVREWYSRVGVESVKQLEGRYL